MIALSNISPKRGEGERTRNGLTGQLSELIAPPSDPIAWFPLNELKVAISLSVEDNRANVGRIIHKWGK
jgi:hypothetical protein